MADKIPPVIIGATPVHGAHSRPINQKESNMERYSVWFEWDLGQEGWTFDTYDEASTFSRKLFESYQEELGMSYDEAVSSGLASIQGPRK